MRAIIVADGDIRAGPALRRALERPNALRSAEPDLVVAADGGALKAVSLDLHPAVVVGDGDSLAQETIDELRAAGVEVIVHPPDKDASDTELAVQLALARGATSIVILGAFGGLRFEHTMANLLLLTLPELQGIHAVLVDGPTTVRVISGADGGQMAVVGDVGDFVSLFALSETVSGVTTHGLRFQLTDEALLQGPTRGLSNELADDQGTVTIHAGRLAVVHTSRTEGPIDG